MNSRGSDVKPSWFLYRYLLGAVQQLQLSMTVRLACVQEDVDRLPEILRIWRQASGRMLELATSEAGSPDQIAVSDPPAELDDRLREIAADPLFEASFSDLPASFKIIEIDKLVAPQREVNLDYVADLRSKIPGKRFEDLVEFCVGPRTNPPELKVLQTAQNQMTFSSRSLDLRFLGGSPKPIEEGDVKVAHMGGQPVEVISLLVGFGAAPINAWQIGRRVVLANGFHRIIALRSAGIEKIPIVVRQVANADIEFPDQFLGLSKGYLLQNTRPVVVKDFFDPALTVELRLKPRRKVLKIGWGPEEGIVPE